MRKNPTDPGQGEQPGRASQRRQEARGLRVRLTPVRMIVGIVTLALLLISAAGALIITTRSYAAATTSLDACTTTTSTPAVGATKTPGATATATDMPTATATPRRRKTPTATPTDEPTDTPTPTPTNTPTPTPTDTPTPTPTDAPTTTTSGSIGVPSSTGGIVLFSKKIHLIAAIGARNTIPFHANAQCAPTTAPTGVTQTPDPNSTTVAAGSTPGATPVITTPGSHSASSTTSASGNSRVVLLVGGVFLVLLVGLGIGWFFFRRMLLPASATSPNLPPSGARPWSRTRVPNPDSLNGVIDSQATLNVGASNFGPGGPGPNMLPEPPMNNGYNGPDPAGFGGIAGLNGAGFGGFSDGFIPPSPQIFPQNENSMIPPGSGAFPLITNANGFAPASPAFNAMYGLPDDPFAGSQSGGPGWMANLGDNNGFNGPPASGQNGGNFAPGQVDLNDPYLAEVIRQYSQKSQTVQPQQMSPSPPASPIPQREPRPGLQDSNWLQ